MSSVGRWTLLMAWLQGSSIKVRLLLQVYIFNMLMLANVNVAWVHVLLASYLGHMAWVRGRGLGTCPTSLIPRPHGLGTRTWPGYMSY